MKSKAFVYVLAATIGLTTISCGKGKKSETTETTKRAVKVEVAQVQDIDQLLNFTAAVQPMKKNLISSSQPNRILRILVEVGDKVAKGQTLVQMDPANLVQTRAQLENYERDYKRLVELYNAGGASKQQVDQMKTQLDVSRASFKLLEENITLVSPINGVVTARNYDEGDMATQPILTVMQTQPVKIIINISENYFSMIKNGIRCSVKMDALPNEPFTGSIGLIHPTIDETTRTFLTEVYIPNNNNRIRPGMFGRVELNLGAQKHVVIKDRAVIKQTGSNEQYVFVLENNVAKYRKVEVGRRLDSYYEILNGVNVGEKVIYEGNTRLQDGMEVAIKE